jgi:hypothetical protein
MLQANCAPVFVLVTLRQNKKKALSDRNSPFAFRTIKLGCIKLFKHFRSFSSPGKTAVLFYKIFWIHYNTCPDEKSPKFIEPVSKCSILFEIKEGENFNHRNTWSISRIKI